MVIGVFYRHEIANSSPVGQDQTSSLLSHRALFIASICPPRGDGMQQDLIIHVSPALNSHRVRPGKDAGTCLCRDAAIAEETSEVRESIKGKNTTETT